MPACRGIKNPHFTARCCESCAQLSVVGVLELQSFRVKFPLPLDPGHAKSRKVYFNYTIYFPSPVTHGSNQASMVQNVSSLFIVCKSIAKL